jgi:uncharacterized protein (DUF488 family)
MNTQLLSVLTIGHSTHKIETFVGLLRKHGVTALVDVRSAPFSRFNPQFNKDALERDLKAQGIQYVFLGRELGARSDDPACYENGRVQYARLAQTAVFRSGLDRVMDGATKYRLALMCAEKEPLECHRTLLVARALVERGVAVEHILADGSLESHDAALTRLLELVGLPEHDLFRGRQQLIDEGMARQEERIAFVDEKLAAEARGEGQ